MERCVLFLCVENSGRSQMAEAFLREIAPSIRASSAGTMPSGRLNPLVVQAMAEVGIGMEGHAPKPVPDLGGAPCIMVSMGCMDESCVPQLGGGLVVWDVPDPKGRGIAEVREIRDRIRGLVLGLAKDLGE